MIHWQGGLAEVVEVKGAVIVVQCPHCGGKHTHGRQMLGSRNAVAGCHAGPRRLREYRIPEGRGGKQWSEKVEPGAFRKSLKRATDNQVITANGAVHPNPQVGISDQRGSADQAANS